jgi:hypothetical protein
MPGDKAVARTVGVLALVLLALVALRGHLPGAPAEPAEPAQSGPGSLVAVIAMVAVSMAIIAIAVVNQTRRPAPAPSAGPIRRDRRGEGGAIPWKLLAVAAAGLLAWLVVVALLMRWGAQLAVDDPPAVDPEPVPAPDSATPDPQPPPEAPDDGRPDVFGLLAGVTVALIVLSAVVTFLGRRQSAPPAAAAPGSAAPAPPLDEGPDLARAAEVGLAEIGDRSRDPRAAIIACYAAMERELEKSPGTHPQDSDTPSEVLARAVQGGVLRADSATDLVDLFEEARFSPHVMTEDHRADAIRALETVRSELQGVP